MEFYKKHNHIFYFMISRSEEVYLIYSHKPEGVKCPRGSDCKSVTSRLGHDVTGLSPVSYYGFASYCSTVAVESHW